MSQDDLLRAYDRQLRGQAPARLPAGMRVELDGPLLRMTGFGGRGMVEYRNLGGLEGHELDDLIDRQVRFFAERGEAFEWKLHAHDQPGDLAVRLEAAGFVPEDVETVVIGPVDDVSRHGSEPADVTLRHVSERADLERIAEMESAVWDDEESTRADDLEQELAADPEGITVVVAEAGETIVCAGWVRFPEGTEFATLWGGGTLPAWRGRGIYRALVAHRARLAAERGRRYVEVDASDASRPILERLGFVAVTTTTPFIWAPPRASV